MFRVGASDEVAVFGLGRDARLEELIGLLTRHDAQPTIIDAREYPELSPLLAEPESHRHFPLLCLRGAIVGGLEAVRALEGRGELSQLLRVQPPAKPPQLAISRTAMEQLRSALVQASQAIRLTISAELHHELGVDEFRPGDIELRVGELSIVLDGPSAGRAEGVAIDWVESPEGGGFRVDNPNEPHGLRAVTPQWLVQSLEAEMGLYIIDARTEEEFEAGHLASAHPLDTATLDAIAALPRVTPLLFYCRSGTRSRRAAERHRELGFERVYWLEGGLEQWHRFVESLKTEQCTEA